MKNLLNAVHHMICVRNRCKFKPLFNDIHCSFKMLFSNFINWCIEFGYDTNKNQWDFAIQNPISLLNLNADVIKKKKLKN